jgi:transposase
MEVLYARCGGLDVHQRFVVTCLSVIEGGQRHKETRTFRCVTPDLLALRRWLAEEGCTHVALESTGVYWRPVYDRLVGTCEVIVANAQHIKKVPGRKTDVQDAEWLADLLQHGLLTPSFVPDQAQQDLRGLTRLRLRLVQNRSQLVNRLHKILEEGGIKLASVRSRCAGRLGTSPPVCPLRGRTRSRTSGSAGASECARQARAARGGAYG